MRIKIYKKTIFITMIFLVMVFGVDKGFSAADYDCNNPHPDWILCDDFERDTILGDGDGWYDMGPWPNDPALTSKNSVSITNTQGHGGGRSLRAYWAVSYGQAGIWAHHNFTPQDTIYVRYYRMFDANWTWAGINQNTHHTYVFAGWYNKPTQTDFTIYEDATAKYDPTKAMLVTRSYTQTGLMMPLENSPYTPVTSVTFQDYRSLGWNVETPVNLDFGRWYEVQFMVKLNTPGQQDGEIKLWVEGTLVSSYSGLIMRNAEHSNIQFNHFMFGPNFTPMGPTQAQSIYLDDLVISTSYILTSADTISPSPPVTKSIK